MHQEIQKKLYRSVCKSQHVCPYRTKHGVDHMVTMTKGANMSPLALQVLFDHVVYQFKKRQTLTSWFVNK